MILRQGTVPFSRPITQDVGPFHDAEVYKEVIVSVARTALSGPIPMTMGFVGRIISMDRGIRSICCPDCQDPLDLLQPDEEEPARLLGTCESCSKWLFLVEIEPEWKQALLVELPSAEAIRERLDGLVVPR
jgi:hypothetical protein